MSDLELWGGIECTVNRVGDTWRSQLHLGGHATRPGDLDLVAGLGIRTLRYPVLWELTAPDGLASADWSWPDARLARLRELGIEPIVGLVHHGSGPRCTHLLDPGFAPGLAEHARAVARRYPWVRRYTPVNEPLTTARFAALYGHWYPHARDGAAFVRALVNQCRGIVLSMEAIRDVRPDAELVQTDDLGTCYGTARLAYQVRHENERRWLAWDLVAGRVDRDHALWRYLLGAGIEQAELEWFREHACRVDVVGINHYLTSDRFLHERPELFPPAARGGNGRDAYADVEAVRVLDPPVDGLAPLLREAWQRYGVPVAVTEAHLGCSREEQLRWLHDIWRTAREARADGVDVRAVTAWALFGSHDWNTLVTASTGYYEPGAFDVRGGTPRPTALAALVRDYAHGVEPRFESMLALPGWWRRPDRLRHALDEEARASATTGPHVSALRAATPAPVLITGASGTLGQAFARLCAARGLAYRILRRDEFDIASGESVREALDAIRPWALVNAAGYVRVDDAEHDADRCWRENAAGPGVLAAACAERDVRLLTFSSDLVFDGTRATPYVESDVASPLNVYGRSKASAERAVLERLPDALVVRTSAFFGPWDRYNFVTLALEALRNGAPFAAANDAVVSPTYVPDLVGACLDLLIDGETGLWHLANAGGVTWAELAVRAAAAAGVPPGALVPRPCAELGLVAARPRYSVLTSERAVLLPSLDDALARYVAALAA